MNAKMESNRSNGFTLIELLSVLAVVLVVYALAAPALSAAGNTMRLGPASQSLFVSIQLARSEAIKRGSRVVLCKSAGGLDCSRSGGWEQGWIVFQDVNNNAQVDAGEVILQRQQAVGGSVRMNGNTPVESYLSYTPLGNTRTTGGGLQAGTLTACVPAPGQTSARQIVISSSGRPRTQKVTLDHCL